jgi:hypothetical protein
MRITTYDLGEHKTCGIEIPLRRLAASPTSLESAKWQKLLDLVTHLQSCAPEEELRGQILLEQVLLHKPEPPDPVRYEAMKNFMDEWRALNPDSTTWGVRLSRDMRRRFPAKPGVCVTLRVDWRDYAPLRDGFPEMHYRFQIKRPGKVISEDFRAKDPLEAHRIICEAFGL